MFLLPFLKCQQGLCRTYWAGKKTIILGAACSAICISLYAIGISYWFLFLGALFQGLSRAFYSGNNDALLMDTLKETGQEKEYHSHLGKISSMFQVALAGAAVIGSLMASKSFALVMWASVVPQICAFIVALKIKEPQVHIKQSGNIFKHIKESLRQFKINNKLRLATIASALRFSMGESAYFLRQAFFKTLWPLWALGIPQMIGNICGAFSYYFSGKIINKFGLFKVLNFEIISNRIVNLIAIIFPTAVSPLLMASTSLTFGVGSVATNSLLQKEFTDKQRATMVSLNSLAGNILFGIFAVLLGYIADKLGLIAALIIAQIILLIPLFYYRKIFVK